MKTKLLLGLALVLSGGQLRCPAQMNTNPVNPSPAQLVEEFSNSQIFWQQFEIGKKIAALHDTNVLQSPVLTDDLTNEDRHVRGNAAFIFAALGDQRGFETLQAILNDRSVRPEAQGVAPNWALSAQIATDRYYAVHLFGDLKARKAVPILIPLLQDKEVNYIVPWSLGEIGDKRAIPVLIAALDDKDPSIRVLTIYSLERLQAVEALPRLRELLNDHRRTNFGHLVTVAEEADEALAELKLLVLHVAINLPKAAVHIKERFPVTLCVENPTATNQLVHVMSCSSYQNWQVNNTNISIVMWDCTRNITIPVNIPPGGAYTNELQLIVDGRVEDRRLSFRMGFTPTFFRPDFPPTPDRQTVWSDEKTIHVVR